MKVTKDQARAMKKLYALGEKRSIDLSLSENPLGCSSMVFDALKNIELNFNDYPKANGLSLREALAKKFDLSSNNFFVGNGSDSIIASLPRVFGSLNDEIIIPSLTFPMFKISSELAGKRVISSPMDEKLEIDLCQMKKLVSDRTSMIFLCNPNNPTGALIKKKEILQFLSSIPKNILLVVDEANIEFGGETMINEVANQENLIVLRTFSKGFGLANLRIGFAVASKRIIQKLEEETPVFPISGLSEMLSMAALQDEGFIEFTNRFVVKERILLRNGLKKLGFIVFPSEANNLFVKLPDSIDSANFKMMLKENDISLVMGSNFEGFKDNFFRVSVRGEDTNKLFLDRVSRLVKKLL